MEQLKEDIEAFNKMNEHAKDLIKKTYDNVERDVQKASKEEALEILSQALYDLHKTTIEWVNIAHNRFMIAAYNHALSSIHQTMVNKLLSDSCTKEDVQTYVDKVTVLLEKLKELTSDVKP